MWKDCNKSKEFHFSPRLHMSPNNAFTRWKRTTNRTNWRKWSKNKLALERRQDTKSLGYDIVQEALRAVDDLLLDDSLSHQKESTNKWPKNSPWWSPREDVTRISALMRQAGVHVLVNFDETFIHFYPSDDYVCGATRVGSKFTKIVRLDAQSWLGWNFFRLKCSHLS